MSKRFKPDIEKLKQTLKAEVKLEFEKELITNAGLNSDRVSNGLQGALFGSGVPGGGIPIGPNSQAVSQVNPLFNNLRWYFISNFWQALSELYCELGLIQVVVDVPVDDALRGGVEVISKQLSEDDLEALRDKMTREDDINKLGRALKWVRLYGGGGILVLTDQPSIEPLNIEAIKSDSPLEFRAVDMWELYFDLQNTEGYDAAIQEEKYDFYSYYGQKIQKTRVLKMKGLDAPSFLRPRLRGWGFSVVESLVRSINQYLKGTDLIYELLDEAKIDVFGIKNLTNTLLAPQGTAKVRERITLANRQKNFQHALVMDAEDKYEQKTLTFSGLAEVMQQIRYQVAADLRMPITKIFGISASGFNSGEDDIEVYNGMIESTIRTPAKHHLLKMVELRCQQMFGFIPDDLSIEFKSLRVLSAEQEQKVKDSEFMRLQQSLSLGAITPEEFRDGCNKHNLLGIQLDDTNFMDGSDGVGNVPGRADEEIQTDKDRKKEDDQANLSYLSSPPAIKKSGSAVKAKD